MFEIESSTAIKMSIFILLLYLFIVFNFFLFFIITIIIIIITIQWYDKNNIRQINCYIIFRFWNLNVE